MRLAWLTDVHLDHVRPEAVDALWDSVRAKRPDAVLLTGDLSVASRVEAELERARERLRCPVYFVLGNHDYYGGSLGEVRGRMRALTERRGDLVWLPARGVVELAPGLGLLGHDGWADARAGDPEGSRLAMRDWFVIAELRGLAKTERLERLRALGDEAAAHLREHLPSALSRYERVLVLLHPPPFPEACRYYGLQSPAEWQPHLCCFAAGTALRELALAHPRRSITVLAGHTHGRARVSVERNLEVRAGSVEYGKPAVQSLLEL